MVVHVVIFDVPCVPTFVGVLLWAICAASDCARRVKLLVKPSGKRGTGLLSNQGEKSINLYFIMVPLRTKY